MNDKTYETTPNAELWESVKALTMGVTFGVLGSMAMEHYSEEPTVEEATRNTPVQERRIDAQDLDPREKDGKELTVSAVKGYDTFTEEGIRFVFKDGEGETESFMAPTDLDERAEDADYMEGSVYRLPDGGYLTEIELNPERGKEGHSQTLLAPEGDGYQKEELEEDEFYDTSDLPEVDVEKYMPEEGE